MAYRPCTPTVIDRPESQDHNLPTYFRSHAHSSLGGLLRSFHILSFRNGGRHAQEQLLKRSFPHFVIQQSFGFDHCHNFLAISAQLATTRSTVHRSPRCSIHHPYAASRPDENPHARSGACNAQRTRDSKFLGPRAAIYSIYW